MHIVCRQTVDQILIPSRVSPRRPVRPEAYPLPHSPLAAPVASSFWGGQRRRTQLPSWTDSPRLSERSAGTARSELRGAPQKLVDAGCPQAKPEGRRQQGRILGYVCEQER